MLMTTRESSGCSVFGVKVRRLHRLSDSNRQLHKEILQARHIYVQQQLSYSCSRLIASGVRELSLRMGLFVSQRSFEIRSKWAQHRRCYRCLDRPGYRLLPAVPWHDRRGRAAPRFVTTFAASCMRGRSVSHKYIKIIAFGLSPWAHLPYILRSM